MALTPDTGLDSPSVRAPDAVAEKRRRGLWRPILWASVGILLLASSGLAWRMMHQIAAAKLPLAVSVLAPADTTITGAPALAPDGRAIAFEAVDRSGTSLIWMRSFDRLEAQALAGTEDARQPFWSPDSRRLGFFARGRLWTIDLRGAATARSLADVSDPRGGTWGRDGTIVYSAQPDRGLYRVAADGGPAMPLTTIDRQRQEISHEWPRFLPDGRMILFLNRVSADAGARSTITAVSVDGRDMKPIVDAESTGVFSSDHLLYCRSGQILAQPFDWIELRVSGQPALVANTVWAGNTAGLVGFDAIEDALATRPIIDETSQGHVSVIDLRFKWTEVESR